MRTTVSALCTALSIVASAASAETVHHVPADFLTIQGALDASVSGDIVLVAPGTYHENIVMTGLHDGVSLLSESGAGATIIDGSAASSVFRCQNLSRQTRIEGFTIQNGHAAPGSSNNLGGGLRLDFANLTIERCIIQGNSAEAAGGMYVNFSEPLIRDNLIRGNEALASAGGIYCDHFANALIERNVIVDNEAGHFGGGISIWADSSARVVNNTIGLNSATLGGGGIFVNMNSHPQILRNIVFKNGGGNGVERGDTESTINLGCNDVWANAPSNYAGIADQTGINGNINVNPLFCDQANSDFTLDEASPCAPSGSPPGCALIGALDIGCGAVPVEAATWGQIKSRYLGER